MSQPNQKKKYDSIVLIPTDFSEVCGNAISHGVKLARFLGYRVCILHVINTETKAALKKKNVGVDYVEWRLKEYKKYYEKKYELVVETMAVDCLLYTSPSPRDGLLSRMPSSA